MNDRWSSKRAYRIEIDSVTTARNQCDDDELDADKGTGRCSDDNVEILPGCEGVHK